MTEALQWRVPVGSEETSAIFEPPLRDDNGIVFVCAHGAGGHMRDRSMEALAETLRRRGIGVLRFNFLYREEGSRRPDPMPRLRQCMSAVIDYARQTLNPRTLLIGGRSMGG